MAQINLATGAAPGTPSAGVVSLYAKTDKTLAYKDDAGTEKSLGLTLGTSVASTSGTSIDFTSIPAGTKRITVSFSGVSTSGTSPLIVQIGDGGGIETTGYLGAVSGIATTVATENKTNGFGVTYSGVHAAASVWHGQAIITLLDSTANTWVCSSSVGKSDTTVTCLGAGSKSTSATLDRVRITTAGGTETFDAGTINISYE